MLTISREYTFDAAHRLPGLPSGHKCGRLHGHTWRCRVWITGPLESSTGPGWICDYAEVDAAWDEHVHRVLDHRDLNDVIPKPTTEHLVLWIYQRMTDALQGHGVTVVRITLCEGGGRCGAAELSVELPA